MRAAYADAKVSEPYDTCQRKFFGDSSWCNAEWSRSVYIRRELRRLGNEAIACPQTATAEALKRPGVCPKREIGDFVTKWMVKTRMSSGKLQCEKSPILGKAMEESWTHW